MDLGQTPAWPGPREHLKAGDRGQPGAPLDFPPRVFKLLLAPAAVPLGIDKGQCA
jgi:hypothetical protein